METSLPIERYQRLLDEKTQKLTALLAPFNAPELQVFASPKSHYRMRAEFRLWHDQDDSYHIMFDPQTRRRYRVDQFPVAGRLINRMMAALPALLKTDEMLRNHLFQIDYLSTLSDKIIVSLLYHKELDERWEQAARALKARLQNMDFDVQIIGRAAGRKINLERDYIDEVLPVCGKNYIYRQVENSFTQPNAAVNCKMLEWAIECTRESRGDLLELYCGNGNFSVALAQNFRKVLATEIAKPSVAAAQFNIKANGVDNLRIIRMSAEDFTQAVNGVRTFNRLADINLKDYRFNTVLVDPPRAGLDSDTLQLVRNYARILYISCNPHTLCANLAELCRSHRIAKAALFDQFPYTEHMECGVWLIRK